MGEGGRRMEGVEGGSGDVLSEGQRQAKVDLEEYTLSL